MFCTYKNDILENNPPILQFQLYVQSGSDKIYYVIETDRFK